MKCSWRWFIVLFWGSAEFMSVFPFICLSFRTFLCAGIFAKGIVGPILCWDWSEDQIKDLKSCEFPCCFLQFMFRTNNNLSVQLKTTSFLESWLLSLDTNKYIFGIDVGTNILHPFNINFWTFQRQSWTNFLWCSFFVSRW